MAAFPTAAQRQHFQQCVISTTEVLNLLKNDLPNHSPGSMHLFAYKVLKSKTREEDTGRYKLGIRLHPSGNILLSGQEVTTLARIDDIKEILVGDFDNHFTRHPDRGQRWYLKTGTREVKAGNIPVDNNEQAEAAAVQFSSPQKPIGDWK